MLRFVFGICVAFALLGAAAPALAQPAGTLAERLEALEKEVESLEEAAVQVPTLAESAQKLSEQVTQLRQRLDTLEAQQKTIPDAVDALDQLTLDARALEKEVALLRTELANLAQPSESTAGGGVTYSAGDGFTWQTGDGHYRISIDGYVQPRYELGLNEDVDDVEENGFRLRRARLGVRGHLGSERLTFRLLTDLTSEQPVLDYYAGYRVRDWLTVRAGQWKVPYTRMQVSSSTRRAFPGRTLVHDRFRYNRDIQVGARGKVLDGRLGYEVAVGNGAGRNRLNDNIDLQVSGRVDAVAVGERFGLGYGDVRAESEASLMVGLSAVHDLTPVPASFASDSAATGRADIEIDPQDVDVDGEVDNVRVVSAALDVTFRHRGLELAGEGLWRYEDWGTILEGQAKGGDDLSDLFGTDGSRSYLGVLAQATYMVKPSKLMVGARAAWGDVPFLGPGDRPDVVARGETRLELSGLCQLYDDRGLRTLGLQYDYVDYGDLLDNGDVERDKEHRLLLEWQLKI